MVAHPFDAKAFEAALQQLTVNSRAIIAELTILAESNPASCDVIVELVENRIKRCLPSYKLNALYLLDSIVKNVGSPYNVIFGRSLFRIFLETYLIVTDTPTRQCLIDLFKTWKGAKTVSGSDLFASPVLDRIEKFIIKATSIAADVAAAQPGASTTNNTSAEAGRSAATATTPANVKITGHSNVPPSVTAKITPDMLLRECRSLLEYCINLDRRTDSALQFPDIVVEASRIKVAPEIPLCDVAKIKELEKARYALVNSTNSICDAIVALVRCREPPPPEVIVQRYGPDLRRIRDVYDEQMYEFDRLSKAIDPQIKLRIKALQKRKQKQRLMLKLHQYNERNRIELDSLKPCAAVFADFSTDPASDAQVIATISEWGHVERVEIDKGANFEAADTSSYSASREYKGLLGPEEKSMNQGPTPLPAPSNFMLGLGNFSPSISSLSGANTNDATSSQKAIHVLDDEINPAKTIQYGQAPATPMEPILIPSSDNESEMATDVDTAGAAVTDYISSLQPDPYENEYPTNMPSLAQIGGIMRLSLKRSAQDKLSRVVKRVRFQV